MLFMVMNLSTIFCYPTSINNLTLLRLSILVNIEKFACRYNIFHLSVEGDSKVNSFSIILLLLDHKLLYEPLLSQNFLYQASSVLQWYTKRYSVWLQKSYFLLFETVVLCRIALREIKEGSNWKNNVISVIIMTKSLVMC